MQPDSRSHPELSVITVTHYKRCMELYAVLNLCALSFKSWNTAWKNVCAILKYIFNVSSARHILSHPSIETKKTHKTNIQTITNEKHLCQISASFWDLCCLSMTCTKPRSSAFIWSQESFPWQSRRPSRHEKKNDVFLIHFCLLDLMTLYNFDQLFLPKLPLSNHVETFWDCEWLCLAPG